MRLIGRERGYHGVNFGGTAVGGIAGNRKIFGALVAGVDHMRHTHDLAKNAFSRGQPKHGAELADDLERLCQLHDPSTIAAVIVEPVACSTGVLVPPVGLSRAPARDLRPARHPAHIRRSDHRLGAPGQALRLAVLRRHARPDHHRQRHHQRHGADGRGADEGGDLPGLHGRAGRRDRDAARLHLLRASARLRGRAGDARRLPGGRPAHPRRGARGLLGRAGARAEGPAERDRHPQHRPDRGDRVRAAPGRAGHARLRRAPEGVREGRLHPLHGRHHRARAAARSSRRRRSTSCSRSCARCSPRSAEKGRYFAAARTTPSRRPRTGCFRRGGATRSRT